MPVLEISAKNLLAGESSADYVSDKGFSPDSTGLNLTKVRGVLYFNEAATARHGAVLTGNIIASFPNPATSAIDEVFIDDEGAHYTYDGSSSLLKTYAGDTDRSFQLGTTDLIAFKGQFYSTSSGGSAGASVAQLSDVFVMVDTGWWGTDMATSNRHPLEVVEDNLFIGNGNVIYYWNGTTSGTAFTLPTQSQVTSLRKHPDGKTLLAFCGTTNNFSHALPNPGKVYYCNTSLIGIAAKGWDRETMLDSQVEGTKVHGGVIYCTWGKNFGYFDGNGLQLLKRLDTSATTYSHNIANMEDILLIRDGIYVKAFGDLGAGKVWWNAFKNNANSEPINCLCYIGSNKLLVAHKGDSGGTGYLYEQNYANSGTTGGVFFTNRINVGYAINVRRIELIHDSAGVASFNFGERDIDGNTNNAMVLNYTGTDAVTLTRQDVSMKGDLMQFRLLPVSGTIGFKLIRIYYDVIG